MMNCTKVCLSAGRAARVRSALQYQPPSFHSHHSNPCSRAAIRRFASTARPVRRTNVSPAERAALRATRKEQASKVMEQQQLKQTSAAAPGGGASAAVAAQGAAESGGTRTNMAFSRYIWYLSVGVPSILLAWGFSDENSPPAKLCRNVGLTGYIRSYTDEIAKPAHTKLLPDWAHVRFFFVTI